MKTESDLALIGPGVSENKMSEHKGHVHGPGAGADSPLWSEFLYEPRREKTGFLHMRKQRGRSAKLISAFVFATWIVQSLLYLNPKFQASSHLVCLYSLVCVGPGRKPRRPVFSQRGSIIIMTLLSLWSFVV